MEENHLSPARGSTCEPGARLIGFSFAFFFHKQAFAWAKSGERKMWAGRQSRPRSGRSRLRITAHSRLLGRRAPSAFTWPLTAGAS